MSTTLQFSPRLHVSGFSFLSLRILVWMLAGVAMGYGKGETEYRFSGTSATQGTIDTTLTSVYPYARYSPQAGFSVWATLGYGWGEATLDDGDSDAVETDLKMLMGAVGGRQELLSAGGMDWSLKADAFAVQLESEEREEDLLAVKAESQRLRLAVEGVRSLELGAGRTLSGSVELGGRLDGGDADEGAGAEFGGGLSYANADLGLDLEASGRSLLVHGAGGFDEWSASLAARFDPGVAGRGLHMSIEPSWGGAASSGVDALWRDSAVVESRSEVEEAAADASSPDMVMAARAGYGLGLMHDRGLLTPFGAMTLSDGSSAMRLGTRFTLAVPRGLDLGFEFYGEQEDKSGVADAGRNLVLDTRIGRGFGGDFGTVEVFSKLQAGDEEDYEVGLSARMNF